MKPRLKKSSPSPTSKASPPKVRFALRRARAGSVAVAGSFNDWQPTSHPMTFDGHDTWHLELELPPGTHEYRFIVDGDWRDDPEAILSVVNPFGSENAVRVVELAACATSPHERAHKRKPRP
jgi:1,4-alpha-glucan branching enzyme